MARTFAAPRTWGGLLASAWALQFVLTSLAWYAGRHLLHVRDDVMLGHLIVALIGVVAGVLAARGSAYWKWSAALSGLAFFGLMDFHLWSATVVRIDLLIQEPIVT